MTIPTKYSQAVILHKRYVYHCHSLGPFVKIALDLIKEQVRVVISAKVSFRFVLLR